MRYPKCSAILIAIVCLAAAGRLHAEKRVMFVAKEGSNPYQLYSIHTNGTGLTKLTDFGSGVWNPAWDYVTDQAAYLSTNDAGGGDIRICNLDGTGDRWIDNNSPALSVQWYDTNTLFYTRSMGSPYDSYQLWRVKTDGTGESQVFTNTFRSDAMGQRHFYLDRARDKVYFTSYLDSTPPTRIRVGTLGASNTLSTLPVQSPLMLNNNHYAPVVSPDGSNVIYCSEHFARHRPYIGNADGSGGAQPLMTTNCGSTTWGPSGNLVAFTWNPTTSTYGTNTYVGDIVIMDPNDSDSTNNLTISTPVAGNCSFPIIYDADDTPTVTLPTIQNDPPSNVTTPTNAGIYVSLVDTGGAPTSVDIYWGMSDGGTNSGHWDTTVHLGQQNEGKIGTTVEIVPNRQYWYRGFASNTAGSGWAPASDVFGYAAPASLPFSETFDSRIVGGPTANRLGSLDYQNGWRSTPPDGAIVQNNVAHGGSNSVRLSTGSMRRAFTGDTYNVWTETYAKVVPATQPTNIPPDATAIFWFNSDGHVTAYDALNPRTQDDTSFPLDGWLRIVTHSDYLSKEWSLWVNGTNVLAGFSFFSTSLNSFASISVVESSTNSAYVDDILVATNSPGSLTVDSDGDRMCDIWERYLFDNDLRTAGTNTDYDFDGFIDVNEFFANTDPLNTNSLLKIRSIQSHGNGRYEIGFDSVDTRQYTVYTYTNALPVGSWDVDNVTPIPGNLGTTMYTVTVDNAVQTLNIRVGTYLP